MKCCSSVRQWCCWRWFRCSQQCICVFVCFCFLSNSFSMVKRPNTHKYTSCIVWFMFFRAQFVCWFINFCFVCFFSYFFSSFRSKHFIFSTMFSFSLAASIFLCFLFKCFWTFSSLYEPVLHSLCMIYELWMYILSWIWDRKKVHISGRERARASLNRLHML